MQVQDFFTIDNTITYKKYDGLLKSRLDWLMGYIAHLLEKQFSAKTKFETDRLISYKDIGLKKVSKIYSTFNYNFLLKKSCVPCLFVSKIYLCLFSGKLI